MRSQRPESLYWMLCWLHQVRTCSVCWGSWDENQHLHLQSHGSPAEQVGLPSALLERSCLKRRLPFTREGKMEREIERLVGAARSLGTSEPLRCPNVPWKPPLGDVPSVSHQEEVLRKTQDLLERLCLSASLEVPQTPPGRAEELKG